jgi:hypothetical protein
MTARVRSILINDMTRTFAECRTPMLFVQASSDRVVPSRVLQELLLLRPDLEHALIDGPHLLLQRRPSQAAAVIGQFLSGLDDKA